MSEKGSGRRAERSRGLARGLLGTIFTGTLVVAAGFSVGVVAGLALEDPGLVKGYVSGETRELELHGPEAQDAAPRPDGPRARPPVPDREGFSVQVGAFGDVAAARGLAEQLEGAGYPVYVAPPAPGGEPINVPDSTRSFFGGACNATRKRKGIAGEIL